MKIVFFGTSSFAARVLEYLLKQGIDIPAVVTRPDKPKGRSLQLSFSAVKEKLNEIRPDIPLHQPPKASTAEFASLLQGYQADLFVVVAYGEIIKQNILSIPKLGCINIHASLLPKYRGAAPIQRCLMAGEKKSGITIIDMVLQMDAGDMLERAEVVISEEMNFGELEEKLCALACESVLKVIRDFENGSVVRTPQNHELATFAAKIIAADEEIHWEKPAFELHNLIRALAPFPGAWATIKIGDEIKRLKIKRAQIVDRSGKPGEIISFNKEGFIVACGEKALQLLEVQPEGKKSMKADDFMRGIKPGLKISFSDY